MKLLVRRDHRPGRMGGPATFQLVVRADLSPVERAAIAKYRLGEMHLYSSHELTEAGSGLLGWGSRLVHQAMSLTVTVDDLFEGRVIDCQSVVEMLDVEAQIIEAARGLQNLLSTIGTFGREMVVDI